MTPAWPPAAPRRRARRLARQAHPPAARLTSERWRAWRTRSGRSGPTSSDDRCAYRHQGAGADRAARPRPRQPARAHPNTDESERLQGGALRPQRARLKRGGSASVSKTPHERRGWAGARTARSRSEPAGYATQKVITQPRGRCGRGSFGRCRREQPARATCRRARAAKGGATAESSDARTSTSSAHRSLRIPSSSRRERGLTQCPMPHPRLTQAHPRLTQG